MASRELAEARERIVDQVLRGDVRNMQAPIKGICDPEPSKHPDWRMSLTLKDIGRDFGKYRIYKLAPTEKPQ